MDETQIANTNAWGWTPNLIFWVVLVHITASENSPESFTLS